MAKQEPLIKAKSLYKTYYTGDVSTPVLHGMDFEIDPGEFVAIMGPSGSGKSTLLHILGFLDEATKGTFAFEGKTADDYTKDEIAHVRNQKMGFVFQAFNLLPRTTVLENIKLPLIYSDIPESEWNERSIEAAKSVGLEHRLDHQTAQLSGGEKQRVAIARALVNEPTIIFADEPTGNLDSKSGQKIMDIFQELNEKLGHTIILITHETYTAEHAKRIIKILDGQIESDRKVRNHRKAKTDFKK